MQSQTSEEIAEALDRDLARKLQQQVAEWKAMRAPAMTRTAAGIRVDRGRGGARISTACPSERLPERNSFAWR